MSVCVSVHAIPAHHVSDVCQLLHQFVTKFTGLNSSVCLSGTHDALLRRCGTQQCAIWPTCVVLVMQVSERSIVQVFERCHELEVVDIVPARWGAAQDMLLWQTV